MYSYELTNPQDNDSINKFKLSGSNYVQHLFTLMVLICPVLEPSVVIFRACFLSPCFYIVFLVVTAQILSYFQGFVKQVPSFWGHSFSE